MKMSHPEKWCYLRTVIRITLFMILPSTAVFAQQTSFQDSLLERMTGSWILEGTMAGGEVVHDLEV